MWLVKVSGRPVAVIRGKEAVLDYRIAAVIEPCLLAYSITVRLGDEGKIPPVAGWRATGRSEEEITVAIKRCIAFVLHRRPEVVETGEKQKLYEVEAPRGEEDVWVE